MRMTRTWTFPFTLAAVSWIVLVATGVSAGTALRLVVVVSCQVASGAVIWAWARRDDTLPVVELIGMGVAIGTLGALLGAQLTVMLGLGGWGWILPTVLAIALIAAGIAGKVRVGRISSAGGWGWWAIVSSLLIGILALYPSIRRTPLMNGYVVGDSYHGDLVFLEAVSRSLAHLGPSGNLLLSGEAVRYHWFTYAWVGSLTDIAGAEAFTVLTRVLPMVSLIGAACLAAAFAARLSRIVWVPTIAAYLVVVGAYVGASQGVVLTYDSPSAGYSAVIGLAFSLALIEYLYFRVTRRVLILIALLAVGTVGAKISEALVLAAGVALLSLVAFWYARSLRARVWAAAVVTAVSMAATYIAVLAGISGSDTNVAVSGGQQHASSFQGLDPFSSPMGVVLGSIALALAILPRWVGALWLLRGRASRFAPETIFGLGIGVAGLGTLFLLRSGTNAAWFALAASGVIAVLSAVGLGRALATVEWLRPSVSGIPRWRDPVAQSLGFAVLINGLVLMALALAEVSGAPVLWRGPLVAWLAALLLALVVMRSRALHGSLGLRWAAMATSILLFTSIVARFGGPIIWETVGAQATPWVRSLILTLDPAAQFPDAAAAIGGVSADGIRPASVSVPTEDTRGAADGVARTSSIIQWTPALNDAALWLEANALPTDVVAVSDPVRQPFLPIVSGLTNYLAGLPYTSGYTTQLGAALIPERRLEIESFLADPSDEGARDLWRKGVRWLWIRDRELLDLTLVGEMGTTRLDNSEVIIVQLVDPGN